MFKTPVERNRAYVELSKGNDILINYSYALQKEHDYSELSKITGSYFTENAVELNDDILYKLADYLEDVVDRANHRDYMLTSHASYVFNQAKAVSQRLKENNIASRKELEKAWLIENKGRDFEEWLAPLSQATYLINYTNNKQIEKHYI